MGYPYNKTSNLLFYVHFMNRSPDRVTLPPVEGRRVNSNVRSDPQGLNLSTYSKSTVVLGTSTFVIQHIYVSVRTNIMTQSRLSVPYPLPLD